MRFYGIFYICLALALTGGCASHPQSTRLTASDYVYTTSQTAAKLRDSDFLKSRTAQSPRVTIGVNKVENLTSDVIPESEQWMFILDVQNSLDMTTLAAQKNVHFQIPPERIQQMRRDGFGDASSSWEPPTHQMSATFRSIARTGVGSNGYINKRSDQYYLEYTITNLKTTEVEWSGTIEFKRAASGAVQN